MDSPTPKEEMEDRCIYYVEIEVMYSRGTKKKTWSKRTIHIVTRYITTKEIMKDRLSMKRVEAAVYDSKSKNKDARVTKVISYKCVGQSLVP